MFRKIQYYKFCAYGFLKNLRFFEIFFLLYLKEIGLPYLTIGLLYSIRQITINIMEIPSGIMADAFGRRRALLFAFSAYLSSFILFYYSQSFHMLAVAMVLYGLGEAFRSGTHKAIILNYLKLENLLELKTRYYGSTRSWSQMGSALVSLLAAAFYYYGTGYRTLFMITVIPYILDLINIASYPPKIDPIQRTGKTNFFKLLKTTSLDFLLFFKSKYSIKPMFSSAAYIAFFKSSKDYLQPLLLIVALKLPGLDSFSAEKGQALVFGVGFFFIFMLTSFASRNAYRLEGFFNNIERTNNLLYVAGIGSTMIAGILLLYGFQNFAVIIFVLLYLVQNIRRPLMVSYLSTFIDSKILASGLSASSQLETVIIVLFAPLLGGLIDSFGVGGGLMSGSALFLALYPLIKLKPVIATK